MNWGLLIFFIGAAIAAENTSISASDICIEYAECLEKAQLKSSECTASETTVEVHGKKTTCEEAKKVHAELQALYEDSSKTLVTCLKANATSTEELTGKKAEKCSAAASKLLKFSSGARREKRKDKRDKKEKGPKTCVKEARRRRQHCAKLSKCCSIARKCNVSETKDEIIAKKKELKETVKQCVHKEHKDKKGKKNHKKNDAKEDIKEATEENNKKKNGNDKKKAPKRKNSASAESKTETDLI